MNEIKRTLMALASAPEVQDKLFPDFACKGDELVLEFDDAFERAKSANELSNLQIEELEILDQYFEKNSGKKFEKLYLDNSSIYNEPFWEEVRQLANNIIANMGWSYETPNISNSIYVGKNT